MKILEKLQPLGNNAFPYMQPPAKIFVKKVWLKSLQRLGISHKSQVITIGGCMIYALLSQVICVCFPTRSPQQGRGETIYNVLFYGDASVCVLMCACMPEVNTGWLLQSLSTLLLERVSH